MKKLIVFVDLVRLSSFSEEFYRKNYTQLNNLTTNYVCPIQFDCGAEVIFVHDGQQLDNSVHEQVITKLAKLVRDDTRNYVCFHKSGNNSLKYKFNESFRGHIFVSNEFSHSDGVYKDLDAWCEGNCDLKAIIHTHFHSNIINYRNLIIQHLCAKVEPKPYMLEQCLFTDEQKKTFTDLISKIQINSEQEIEAFQQQIKIIDL